MVGVVAILVALLLPALSEARERARRAICLANLRQIHHALVTYAQRHRGAAAVGYWNGGTPERPAPVKQWSHVVRNGGYMRGVGILFDDDPELEGRIFFCPSETRPLHMYNTLEAPWQVVVEHPGTPFVMFAGYATRPAASWYHHYYQAFPDPMPALSRLGNRALVADLAIDRLSLASRHRRGVQVLYGHGGAHWVPKAAFGEWIDRVPRFHPSYVDEGANDEMDEIWAAYDRN